MTMILADEKALERLNSENNLANRFARSVKAARGADNVKYKHTHYLPTYRRGHAESKDNLPVETRNEIAIRARSGMETQEEIAADYGISQQNVSAIATGKTSSEPEVVGKALDKIRDKALDRLLASLGFLTDDKLSGCDAKDLSQIAANVSRVVEKTTPKVDEGSKVQVVVYAPQVRQEEKYKIIEV